MNLFRKSLSIGENQKYDVNNVSKDGLSIQDVTKNKVKLKELFKAFDLSKDGTLDSAIATGTTEYVATYNYNQANVMIEGTHETTHVNGGGCISWTFKCIYEHDINGNLIYQDRYQDSRLVDTYECEYDSRNNHTKEIFYNYVEGITTPFTEYEHQITYRD